MLRSTVIACLGWALWAHLQVPGASESVSDPNRLVFILNSQPNAHHARVALASQVQLLQDLRSAGGSTARVLLTHEDLPLHGAWTYLALLGTLAADYARHSDWFIFLEENTRVNVSALIQVLSQYDPEEERFLGHALKDQQHVIIHHYDQPDLHYPHIGSGFALSRKLVEQMAVQIEESHNDGTKFPTTFSIDPAYELAKFIFRKNEAWQDGAEPPESLDTLEPRLRMDHLEPFCAQAGQEGCATYPVPINCPTTEEELEETLKATLFAVKTCEKFHEERLTVIQETWGPAAVNVIYVSEKEDPQFDTLRLPGLRNTERGHCNKTMSIVNYFRAHARERGWQWLVIADDDTILSVGKLASMLRCYDPQDLVAIGQRYGFRIATGQHGYDYPTGGSSMIFSLPLIEKMADQKSHCRCPSEEHPDDMLLGACLTNMGISLTHSKRLHQGRPEDYHEKLLAEHDPVSFHKFWQTDPVKTYRKWFAEWDELPRRIKFNRAHPHQDL